MDVKYLFQYFQWDSNWNNLNIAYNLDTTIDNKIYIYIYIYMNELLL